MAHPPKNDDASGSKSDAGADHTKKAPRRRGRAPKAAKGGKRHAEHAEDSAPSAHEPEVSAAPAPVEAPAREERPAPPPAPELASRLVSVLQYDGLPFDATTVVEGVLSQRARVAGGAR